LSAGSWSSWENALLAAERIRIEQQIVARSVHSLIGWQYIPTFAGESEQRSA